MIGLDPFQFHGVTFSKIPSEASEQTVGTCPFCDKEEHLFVQASTGLWNCKRCGAGGNTLDFLGHMHEYWLQRTKDEDYERLSNIRGVESGAYKTAMLAWNGNRWLIPIFDHNDNIANLRLWREGRKNPPINTKGIKSALWGAQRLNRQNKARIWICEGEWDGIALSWAFQKLNIKNEVAIAVPGASVMRKDWMMVLSNRRVIMAYDADSAGDEGMQKKGQILKPGVQSIEYVRWPLDVKKGYDVEDLINEFGYKDAWSKLKIMSSTAPRTQPQPSTLATRIQEGVKKSSSFGRILRTYRKWLDMSPDAEKALRVILSVVLSTKASGDPLWLYLVAPPGGGKTALLNPLRSVPDHCVFRSNLTMHSLVSGWQGSQDPSLIPKLDGKTLVLKDMTEILSAPQHVQEEVFGTLRGGYDGTVERSYGNQVYRKYESKFSMVAGVTVQIHGHHRASMGERMLKFQLSRTREEQESIIEKAMENLGQEIDMEEELAEATEAFLNRDVNVDEIMTRIPKGHWARRRILALSQLIARLRMEVERDFRGDQVMYRPQDEVGSRLAKQLLKLAMFLTETIDGGNKEFGKEEWRIVERVAFDTAIGWNLDVIQVIARNGGRVSKRELVEGSRLPPTNVTRRIEDLLILRSITKHFDEDSKVTSFALTDDIKDLWRRSMVQDDHAEIVTDVRRTRKYRLRPIRKVRLVK